MVPRHQRCSLNVHFLFPPQRLSELNVLNLIRCLPPPPQPQQKNLCCACSVLTGWQTPPTARKNKKGGYTSNLK